MVTGEKVIQINNNLLNYKYNYTLVYYYMVMHKVCIVTFQHVL